MQITLNGEKREIPENYTVSDLLASVGINPDRVAVEHEGSIIRPEHFNHQEVQAGATVEIIHFVGGG